MSQHLDSQPERQPQPELHAQSQPEPESSASAERASAECARAAGMSRLEQLEVQQRALEAERLRIIGALVTELSELHPCHPEASPEDRSQTYAPDELAHRSLRAELALVLGVSERMAERLMGLAARVTHEYPAVLGALAAGVINTRHVEVITEAGVVIGAGDDPVVVERRQAYAGAVLEVAVQESPNRLKPVARRLAEVWAETPIETRHAHARSLRRVMVVDGEDGMADLIAHLPVVEAYAIYDRLTRVAKSGKRGERVIPVPGSVTADAASAADTAGAADLTDTVDAAGSAGPAGSVSSALPAENSVPLMGLDPGTGFAADPGPVAGPSPVSGPSPGSDARTCDQFRADALVDLLLSSDVFALTSGCPVEAIDARIQLIAPADLTHAAGAGTGTDGAGDTMGLLGELAGYGPVSTVDIREHAARATHFEKVTTNTETGEVLAVDRYRPSEEMRRRLRARDRRCRFPGCRVPVYRCDLDHTIDAVKGGPTATDNLAHLCRGHHLLKHHSAWGVEQESGGVLRWVSPTGREHVDRPPGAYEPPMRRRAPGGPVELAWFEFRSLYKDGTTMPSKYDPELRQRALRMLAEARPEHESLTAACRHVGGLLGVSPETLRVWQRRYDIDAGVRPGVTTDMAEENRRLRRENAELQKANEVLKAASVFFAKELDRPRTK